MRCRAADLARPILDELLPYAPRNLIQGVPVGWGAAAWHIARLQWLLGRRSDAARFAATAQRLHRQWGAGGLGHPLADLGQQATTIPLSHRESEVLTLLACGHGNSEIAAALGVSVHTIERHVANLFTKLNVTNRAGQLPGPIAAGWSAELHSFRDVPRPGLVGASGKYRHCTAEAAMTDPKIKTVQSVYEAFGRGDVGFILDQLTDDVDWASCPDSDIAPWHGIHRGKAEVPNFFKALAENLADHRVHPPVVRLQRTDVLVVTRFAATAPATGKSAAMDIHHWWRFRDGRIYLYRGTEDTALTKDLLHKD